MSSPLTPVLKCISRFVESLLDLLCGFLYRCWHTGAIHFDDL
jgi:hypothetical protein